MEINYRKLHLAMIRIMFFNFFQLLQVMIAMTVMIWLMVMCVLRKGEGKDLTKASTIVSMPEVNLRNSKCLS